MNTFCRRFVSLNVLPTCMSAFRASSTCALIRSRAIVRLQPITSTKLQKRFSQVEVFGPFDPPKQLTFKEVCLPSLL